MRLDFNVLWVDDQPGRVNSQIEAISRQMHEHGFEFQPTLCRSIDDVPARLADDVFKDEVDLILVDWDLGGDTRGQEAIVKIRGAIPYRDVVFYSAITGAAELRRLAFESDLEGVYCATRQELVVEVMGVFESLVKKVLDLDHTRGIIMGATSDIDFMVRDCLAALHDGFDESGQREMLDYALARVTEALDQSTEMVRKLGESPSLSEILKAYSVFTASDGLRMLISLFKQGQLKESYGQYRDSIVAYREEVLPQRNILGHQILTPEGKAVAVAIHEGNEIRIDEMKALRRRLLELRVDFRNLHKALRG